MTMNRRLKGMLDKDARKKERTYHIKKLIKEANECLPRIRRKGREYVDECRKCGASLIKAKALVKQGEWQEYLKEYFDASRRTAQIYMSLAKNWDSDLLKESQMRRPFLNSIKACLTLHREIKNHPGKKGELFTEKQQKRVDKIRDYIKWSFYEELERLTDNECEVMLKCFDYHFWPKWYGQIREMVYLSLEYSPYEKFDPEWAEVDYHDSEEELERKDYEISQRVRKALNRNKKSA